jgi:hypothetical protein
MARQQNKTIKVPDSSGHKTRDVVLASSGRLIPKARDLGRGGGPAVPHIDFHRLRNQPGAQLGVKRIHPVSVHPGCIDTDKKIRNRKQRKKMSKATSTQSADGGNHTVLGTKKKKKKWTHAHRTKANSQSIPCTVLAAARLTCAVPAAAARLWDWSGRRRWQRRPRGTRRPGQFVRAFRRRVWNVLKKKKIKRGEFDCLHSEHGKNFRR